MLWKVGAPQIPIYLARDLPKPQVLQMMVQIPEPLREEAWLVGKLCFGTILPEIKADGSYPLWLFRCNDHFLGALKSEEAAFLDRSGFRFCEFVKGIYERSDHGPTQFCLDRIDRMIGFIRRTAELPGSMLVGYDMT